MKLIDLHSDTVYQLYKTRDLNFRDNPKRDIDLERLKKADSLVQCISLFTSGDALTSNSWAGWMEYASFYREVMSRYPGDVRMIYSADDIDKCLEDGRQGIMMTVEDAFMCLGDVDRIRVMYDLGARMCSITWNEETCFAYPNSRDPKLDMLGLKPLGREAVLLMNELGMVFDVSHLNTGGTLEALKLSKQPVIASHSNARSVTGHPRNLTDEEIRGIAESGGVIGINLYPGFLSEDDIADIEKTERHIAHIRNVGGDGVLAIGTDFDGFSTPHQTLRKIDDMPLLAEALERMGYTEKFIEGMFFRNAMRVFREVLK